MGAFGDKFRKAREAKSISLEDVSNVTKISARMLRAIEEEHFDQLPGGVFNRGFVRAYAKHLGLNDEEAVTDYLACLRQAQIDAHEVWQPEPVAPTRAGAQNSPATPQRREYEKPSAKPHASVPVPARSASAKAGDELPELQLPRAEHVRRPAQKYLDGGQPSGWKLIAMAILVIVLAGVLWIRHSRSTRNEAAQSAVPNGVPAQPAPTAAAPNVPAEKNSVSAGIQSAAPSVAPAKSTEAGQTPATEAGTSVASPAAAKRIASSNDAGEAPLDSEVTVRTFTNPTPAANAAATMTLVIRARETSWISVTADGQQVSQETLIAPAHASIRASREIVARIGNAAGVTFLFNGREIAAQGAEAEVKTFVFDAQGMREITNPSSAQSH